MTQPLLGWGLTPQALTNVTPFTYRDNATYIELLRESREKIDEIIAVVNLNAGDETAQITAINTAYTALVNEWNAILPNLDPAHVATLVDDLMVTVNAAIASAQTAVNMATTATESANTASAAAVAATNSLTDFQTAVTASVASQVSTAVAAEAALARNAANLTGTIPDGVLPVTAQAATLTATYVPLTAITTAGQAITGATTVAAQRTALGIGYAPTDPYVTRADASYASGMYLLNLPKWKAALDLMRADTRDAKVLVVGDSTAAGVGATTAANFQQAASWPAYMAAELNRARVPAQTGFSQPMANSGAATTDGRWTVAGAGITLGMYVEVGLGGKNQQYQFAGGATGTLAFADPTILADRFDVYYTTSTSAGIIAATATGGVLESANAQTGVKGVTKLTVSAAAAATTNSVVISNTSATGTLFVIGVEPWLSTRRGVRVGNAGSIGSDTSGWVKYLANDTANAWNALAAIPAYAPDLTIIDLGINDAGNSVALGTYSANMQLIINAAAISGDVVLKSMIPHDTRALEPSYVGWQVGTKLPMIDTYARFGTSAATTAAGLMYSDNLHGNNAMYSNEAMFIASALPLV